MSMNIVMVTSLGYWGALWYPTHYRLIRPDSNSKHSIPALSVVLDLCINGLPIRLFHAIYPMTFGIIYATFSYLYYDAGNVQPIYPVIDWSKPLKTALVCTLIIAICPVVQFFFYLLYVGRITLSAHLNGRGQVVVERWWKASSHNTPVKEVFKDIEAVECVEMVKMEISTEANVEGDIEGGKFSTTAIDEIGEKDANKEEVS
nr:hypothetical protein HmN_000519000 [Hymenolepis microstoma]